MRRRGFFGFVDGVSRVGNGGWPMRLLMSILSLWMACVADVVARNQDRSVADSLMSLLYDRVQRKDFIVGEFYGRLYLKQYTDVARKNIFLNMFPDMARFDRDKKAYLTELFYDIHYLDYAIPDIRRRAHVTTHRHGSGEMERILEYMTPNIYSRRFLEHGYLSPMHRVNSSNYIYDLDGAFSDTTTNGCRKVLFKHRFDNIKLLTGGWIILDDSCEVREFYAEGWDEQGRFKVCYRMGDDGLERFMVKDITLIYNYDFAGNELTVSANGIYDYGVVSASAETDKNKNRYDISSVLSPPLDNVSIEDKWKYIVENRMLPLTSGDSLLYAERGLLGTFVSAEKDNSSKENFARWLWVVGDQMISSHSVKWEGGQMKLSPIINPSYLSYSSSRGLSYKLSLNLKNRFKNNNELTIKPTIGYNFKQKAFYWDVKSRYLFDPLHFGMVGVDVGQGNRTYSSMVLDKIEKIAVDTLNFAHLDLNYFRNLYMNVFLQRELFNGFEAIVGIDFHRRILKGNGSRDIEIDGYLLRDKYVQFAPHLRLTWCPGMYYYIRNGRKVNVASRYPRFSVDVGQGVRGILGSNSVYTRAELDVQYRYRVNGNNVLYMRFGGGGYLYTKDVYFVDYTFLKSNNLPVNRNDEIGGVFQLLDSEWYNSANKYVRMNFTYESPFLAFQKLFPRIRFIEHERIYLNMLGISHLRPYSEIGYGIETPYIDIGLFVSVRNTEFYKVGYKVTLSLFRD